MISYYDGQLTDIMPGNIAKKAEVQALSYALQHATRLLYKYSQRLYIYSCIDEQPEEVIDLLASELRTQYYRSDMDLGTKRQLVKNTLIWYVTAGTPAAVEELVAAVFGDGEVKEWFEYGDLPYYFKVVTSALITPEMNDFFMLMIRRVKNARSWLRAIEVHRTTNQEVHAGVGQSMQYKPAAVIDGYCVDRKTSQIIHAGIAAVGSGNQMPILDGYSIEGEVAGGAYLSAVQTTTERHAVVCEGL